MDILMNDHKRKYLLRSKDIYEGNKLICVYVNGDGDDNDDNPKLGHVYTLEKTHDKSDYAHTHHIRHNDDDDYFALTTFRRSDWLRCHFANDEGTWVEFIPIDRFTEEELFLMKLGGVGSVLDLSLQKDDDDE